MERLKVMMTTEGTYPFHQGGVSTWCNSLVHNLPEVDYVIYSIIMNPFVTNKFKLPPNASLIKVPLWGTEEPSEHLTTPFSHVYEAKRDTVDKVVRDNFIPLFMTLVEQLVCKEKNSQVLGLTLAELHKYFQIFDYKKSFKAQLTWDVYKKIILAYTSDLHGRLGAPSVYDLIQSLGWVYRFLIILNTPLPKVNVTHSAAAAFCGIPCILAKIENKTPYILTEHGVYLREQYLSLAKRGYPSFLSTFLIRMITSVASLSYNYADQVSPVCNYNTRWEKEFGVNPKDIKVIYNGVDKDTFVPSQELRPNKYPTVVSVARIDPVKDLISLIKAADIVRDRIRDVRFVVYGSVSVPEYYQECLQLINELELQNTFILAGHTNDIPSVYRSGDVIALSSITEAFPYSVVEAMMTGKPVVATDVGGIKEALGDTGLLVRPRQPQQLATALITLLENPGLRFSMGEEARQRALNRFTTERVIELYLASYRRLAAGVPQKEAAVRMYRQKLLAEKGYALLELGYIQEAVAQFRLALKEAPETYAVPVILVEIANAYNKMGRYDEAFHELEKAEAIMTIIDQQKIA